MTTSNLSAGDAELINRLKELILERFQHSAAKSLRDVVELDRVFLKVDADSVRFLLENRERVVAALNDPDAAEDLVELFLASALDFTYRSNQFVQVSPQGEEDMRRIYSEYITDLRRVIETNPTEEGLSAGLAKMYKKHFNDLRANLTRYFDFQEPQQYDQNAILQRVVCHEYSPAFQLEMLGLNLDEIQPPVLDIGCGRAGRLVAYLNQQGIPAVGVDRLVDSQPYLKKGDWLRLALPPQSWGTILSHMAFSNHFLFHHLYRKGTPERFARQYMAILAALQPGGLFCYSPGLPFMEDLLPAERFRVIRCKARMAAPDAVFADPAWQEVMKTSVRVIRL